MKGQLRRSALPDGLPSSLSRPKRFRLRRLFHSEAFHQSRLAFFDRPFSTDARKGSASLCQDLSPARSEGSASFLDPNPGESAFPINRSASFPGRLSPAKRFHRNGWVFPTRRPLFFASTKPEALHQPRPFPASSNRSASVWEFNRREALQSEKRQKGGVLPLRRSEGPKHFRLNRPGAEWLSNRHRTPQGGSAPLAIHADDSSIAQRPGLSKGSASLNRAGARVGF